MFVVMLLLSLFSCSSYHDDDASLSRYYETDGTLWWYLWDRCVGLSFETIVETFGTPDLVGERTVYDSLDTWTPEDPDFSNWFSWQELYEGAAILVATWHYDEYFDQAGRKKTRLFVMFKKDSAGSWMAFLTEEDVTDAEYKKIFHAQGFKQAGMVTRNQWLQE